MMFCCVVVCDDDYEIETTCFVNLTTGYVEIHDIKDVEGIEYINIQYNGEECQLPRPEGRGL